jgi:integrase
MGFDLPKKTFGGSSATPSLLEGPHTTRHTYASHLLKAQPDLPLLAKGARARPMGGADHRLMPRNPELRKALREPLLDLAEHLHVGAVAFVALLDVYGL